MLLKVGNVGAERISSERLFQATGPATQNARLQSCSLGGVAQWLGRWSLDGRLSLIYT